MPWYSSITEILFTQQYDASGSGRGEATPVAESLTPLYPGTTHGRTFHFVDQQLGSAVEVSADGSYSIIWGEQDWSNARYEDGTLYEDIVHNHYGRHFDSNGNPDGDQYDLPTYGSIDGAAATAVLPDGGFVAISATNRKTIGAESLIFGSSNYQ